jgi:hypothetical protein
MVAFVGIDDPPVGNKHFAHESISSHISFICFDDQLIS